jgi:hypothetical protein
VSANSAVSSVHDRAPGHGKLSLQSGTEDPEGADKLNMFSPLPRTAARYMLQVQAAAASTDEAAVEDSQNIFALLSLYKIIAYTFIFIFVLAWLAAVVYLLWGLWDDSQRLSREQGRQVRNSKNSVCTAKHNT